MPVWATGQLFWQSRSTLHFGTQAPPPSGMPLPVVVVVPPAAAPPLPPKPDVAVVSGGDAEVDGPEAPPAPKSFVSAPVAQAAMRLPVATTKTRTLRLAYFTGL